VADDVQVKFGAQLDGLVAGINDAKTQLQSITAPIAGIKDAFSGLAEAAVAGLGIDKLGEAESKYGELGEQIQRTALILGESTDQVQEMSFAIRMGGGDAETASMTMGIFEKNIAQAASGTGTAATAFENMGIAIKDANGNTRSAIDILKDMAGVLSTVSDANIRAEYGRALMGRGYQNLLPVLLQGKEGFDKLNAILNETGAKMSPEMVAKADELAQHTKILGSAWDGFAHTIESAVLPAYDALIQKTTSAIEHTTAFITSLSIKAPATGGPSSGATGSWGGGSTGAFGPKDYGVQFGPPQPTTLEPLGSGEDKSQKDTLALDDIKTTEELAKLKLQMQKDELDAEVALGKESKVQELGDLQELLGQEYDAQDAALEQKKALYGEDTVEFQEALNQQDVLLQKYLADYEKINQQIAQANAEQVKKTQEAYKAFFDTVDKSLDQMLQGILQGTTTWQRSIAHLFDNLAVAFIENVAKMMLKWAAFEAAQAAFGSGDILTKSLGSQVPSAIGGSQQNNVLNAAMDKLFAALGVNTAAHTAGTVATSGNTLATTSDTIATTTGTVTTTGLTVATTANTLSSSADAASNVAQLGLNTLDTGTNTAAIAANTTALFASKALPSFDVGSWSIPNDMEAVVHQGEMIIPAGPAAAIRSGGFSSGSAGGDQYSITMNINALDGANVANVLQSGTGQKVIISSVQNALRNLNPNLTNAMRT
jgi:TP901 family phage tail tape measure protein